MKPFDAYQESPEPEYPTKTYMYRAYKNGECKTFTTQKEAYKFSSLVEKYWDNEEEYKAQKQIWDDWNTKITVAWYDDLRKEYDHLNDELFDICYSEAYDRGHSSGYDEVANCMINVVDFCDSLIKAYNKQQEEWKNNFIKECQNAQNDGRVITLNPTVFTIKNAGSTAFP